MKKLLLLIFNIILFYNVLAQINNVDVTKVIEENAEWSEGTVFLKNGEQLKGMLKLNTKTGLLGYESGSTSKSFNPRNTLGFEFFDAIQIKTRSFISAEYENPKPPKNNPFSIEKGTQLAAKVPQFFEVLMEFPSFVLLSTVGQMQIDTRSTNPNAYNPTTNMPSPMGTLYTSTSYSQTESLFIMDSEGDIHPVLHLTNKETDGFIFDSKKTKSKRIDNDILKTHTSPHFEELEKYAKERKLSFKKKDDLLTIMEYYKGLITD